MILSENSGQCRAAAGREKEIPAFLRSLTDRLDSLQKRLYSLHEDLSPALQPASDPRENSSVQEAVTPIGIQMRQMVVLLEGMETFVRQLQERLEV